MSCRNVLALLLAAALAACGSAPRGSMDARYAASLARWKGATRDQVLATWGRPSLAQQTADGETIIFVVAHDLRDVGPPPAAVIATGPNGATVIAGGAQSIPVPPVTCTTSFALRGGVVVDVRFEGLGCGAPE